MSGEHICSSNFCERFYIKIAEEGVDTESGDTLMKEHVLSLLFYLYIPCLKLTELLDVIVQ